MTETENCSFNPEFESTKCINMEFKSLDTEQLETLGIDEIKQKLLECQTHCMDLENKNEQNKNHISILETDLQEKKEKIKKIEKDKDTLRNTVKKASENWFQRKAKISESEAEVSSEEEVPSSTDVTQFDELTKTSTFSSKSYDPFPMMFELKFKTEQFELSERRCEELSKRVHDYEKVIDDQENIVHGLKEQLDTYFNDNQKMSQHLAQLVNLFRELEAANNHEIHVQQEVEQPADQTENLPSTDDFNCMSKSVSKTYLKLKELIYEKKSLVTEIERLKTLNVELQTRVAQQESRLLNVSDALQTTWLIVSNLKEDHSKIHTAESILRYELKEKRDILTKLREELELAREQWHTIRKINSDSEEEWKSLRTDLDERKERKKSESDVLDDSELGACAKLHRETSFEPPIDLLLDMGIEYGVVSADADEPVTGVALLGGQNVDEDRLQDLEVQCSNLYQKLMSSTSRALALASRLTALHQHYSASDDEENDDEEYEYVEMEDNFFETDVGNTDTGGYDTAYVSENDGGDSAAEGPSTSSNEDVNNIVEALGEAVEDDVSLRESMGSDDDGCETLSRRLITFLPKKIEILTHENKQLEERIQTLIDEKTKSETVFKASIEYEVRQRRMVEEQLSHLGKCVDELKLERNGKIAKYEEELQKRIKEVQKEQEEYQRVVLELEDLKEKFEERGQLLNLLKLEKDQSDIRATTAEEALGKFKLDLDSLRTELMELKSLNNRTSSQIDSTHECDEVDMPVQLPPCVQDCTLEASKIHEKIAIANQPTQLPNRISEPTSVYFISLSPENLPTSEDSVSLSPGSAVHFPCHIDPTAILRWTFRIASGGIQFQIKFNHLKEILTDADKSLGNLMFVEPTIPLMTPVRIRASHAPVRGSLNPRISGKYCLILTNNFDTMQEVKFQFWMESLHQSTEENLTKP